jgi:CHAT domain-containing protein/tetratricopeptide (TPR) repeat protein
MQWRSYQRFIIVFVILMLSSLSSNAAPPVQEGPKNEGDILREEGLALYEDGRNQEALEKFEEALLAYQAIGDRAGEARALNAIGMAYLGFHQVDQFETALDYFQQSLAITREIDDQLYEARVLQNLGVAYRDLWRLSQAQASLEQALAILADFDEPETAHAAYYNAASVYRRMGQYEKALSYHQQALDLRIQLEYWGAVGASLNDMAVIYEKLGQADEALKCYEESLRIHRSYEIYGGQYANLNNIGGIKFNQDDLEGALTSFKEALAINIEHNGFLDSRAINLNNIGQVYTKQGKYEAALGQYRQALDLTTNIHDFRGQAQTLDNLGDLYRTQTQYELALDYYQQAFDVCVEIGLTEGKASTLHGIGRTYQQQGRMSEAIVAYQQAIEVLENMLNDLNIEEFRAGFVGKQQEIYESMINILWDEGRYSEAFTYIERARARAFLSQMANGAIDFRAGADATLLERERALKAEITARRAQLTILRNRPHDEWDSEAIVAVQAELSALEADYGDLLVEMKLQSPEVAGLVSVDVASLAEVQDLLDPKVTLVEYFITDDRTLAFVFTRDTFKTISLEVSRGELAGTITAFRDFASLDDPYPDSLRQLYEWLIAPLQASLTTPAIGIVPHGILHYLPFAALTDGEGYLSDDYILFSLPSASALRFIQEEREPGPDTLLALGNPTSTEPLPTLRFAEQEVEAAADLYGAHPLVGKAATESAVWSEAGQAGILHLAAHGEYNPFNPLFSTVHLAADDQNDGRLEVHEVYGLDLTAATDLVVLSACQTQLGELSAGDEVVGLNRAFLYAGTPSVMASLWSVDDAATALLMERFYTHLRDGIGKAEALRQAQLEVREEYPNPYYWAGFVLSGDAGEVTGYQSSLPVPETTAAPVEEMPTPTERGKGFCPASALMVALGLGLVMVANRRASP